MSITPETYDAKQYLAALSARMEMEAWMSHRIQRIEIEDGRKFAMEGTPVLREQWRCHELHEGVKPRVAPCNQILLTAVQAARLMNISEDEVYCALEQCGQEFQTAEVQWYLPEIGQIGSLELFHLSDISKAAWYLDGRLAMYESRSEPNG
jgi:hypothetical protein